MGYWLQAARRGRSDASLSVADGALTGADVLPDQYERPQGFFVLLGIDEPADADRVGAQWELPGGVGTQWELRRALARGDQSVGHYDASVHAHVDPRFSPVSAIQAASRTSTGSSRSDRKSTRLNSSHLV